MPPRLLVIDEDEATRHALERVLRFEGYDVHSASTLPGAREIVEHVAIALVVLDLQIGDEGRRFLDALSDLPHVPPILLVSGNPDGASVAAEFAIPFVQRPYEPETLLAAIGVARNHAIRPLPSSARPPPRKSRSAIEAKRITHH
jgi:two-component system, OmpR family, response regulator MprA